jgi:hypothetical protein
MDSTPDRIRALTVVLHKLQPQSAIPVSAPKNEYLITYRHIATLLTTGRGKRVIAVTGSNIDPSGETELTVIDQEKPSEITRDILKNDGGELVAEEIELESSSEEPRCVRVSHIRVYTTLLK